MNRIDRLQAIITQLQSKKVVKAQEIADRFNISLRTVYRDIRALEEGGIPIGSEAGLGYFLDDNYNLPPVMFTQKEANSIIIAGKLLANMSDKNTNQDFQSALYKIKSVLKGNEKDGIEELEKSVLVYGKTKQPDNEESIYLNEIQSSIIKSTVLKIKYFSAYNKNTVTRNIEPIGLIYYSNNWHTIAWCQFRQAYRDFRLDRIKMLTITNEKYDRPKNKSLQEYLENQKQQANLIEIKLELENDIVKYISNSKLWFGYINETVGKNTTLMTFLNTDLEGFSRWVLGMSNQVKIIQPKELKTIFTGHVKKLSQMHL